MTRTLYFLIPIVVFVLDRLSKVLVETRFLLYESKTIIPGVFDLTHTRNTGSPSVCLPTTIRLGSLHPDSDRSNSLDRDSGLLAAASSVDVGQDGDFETACGRCTATLREIGY